jgi:hypothetical protein
VKTGKSEDAYTFSQGQHQQTCSISCTSLVNQMAILYTSCSLKLCTAVCLLCRSVEEVFEHLLGSSAAVFGPDPRRVNQNTPDRFYLPKWEGIREWSQTPFDIKKTTVHGKRVALGCAGDFILMHSEALFTARGYPEVPLHQVLDDVLVMYAQHGFAAGEYPLLGEMLFD